MAEEDPIEACPDTTARTSSPNAKRARPDVDETTSSKQLRALTESETALVAQCRVSTFAVPRAAAFRQVDHRALQYLGGLCTEIAQRQPEVGDFAADLQQQHEEVLIVPLKTRPDGNCLVNAVSMAIFGTEEHSNVLRKAVVVELEQHEPWYVSKLEIAHPDHGAKEFEEAIARAMVQSSFLSNVHVVALANVLRRPLILVGSRQDMSALGVGYHGFSGTFLPLRWLVEELGKTDDGGVPTFPAAGEDPSWEISGAVSKRVEELLGSTRPLAFSWGSSARDHFVPLVAVDFRTASLESSGAGNNYARPVGFPVPTPTKLADGAPKDPFCAPPYVPDAWLDCMCRVCDNYSGCWHKPHLSAGSSSTLTNTSSQILLPGGKAGKVIMGRHLSGRLFETAVDAMLFLQHGCAADASKYATAAKTLHTMVRNLLKDLPMIDVEQKQKFRRINLAGKAFSERVGAAVGGIEVLTVIGFRKALEDELVLAVEDEPEPGDILKIADLLKSVVDKVGSS